MSPDRQPIDDSLRLSLDDFDNLTALIEVVKVLKVMDGRCRLETARLRCGVPCRNCRREYRYASQRGFLQAGSDAERMLQLGLALGHRQSGCSPRLRIEQEEMWEEAVSRWLTRLREPLSVIEQGQQEAVTKALGQQRGPIGLPGVSSHMRERDPDA